MKIHVEIFVASRLLELQKGTFSAEELVTFIEERFKDTRHGVKTHASAVCVANSPLNFAIGHNYLWRIGRGTYRCFRPASDQPNQDRIAHNTQPEIEDVPKAYQYLSGNEESHIPIKESIPQEKITNVLDLIEKCGKKLGFETKREYAVPMGRIDIVWFLHTPLAELFENDGLIPIMGFELETSWRTRKHIKGDIINLQLLKASHGVIILQKGMDDSENEIASLIRSCKELLLKMNAKGIHIWTSNDVVEMCKILDVNPKI